MSVTPNEIAVELGRTAPDGTSPEFAQWELWIADAQMLISARLGDLSALDQARLDYVIRQAVAAHVRRPDDATQVSVSVDDGSVSRTYRSTKGRVEIIDEWWALLQPTEDAGGAFVLDTVGTGTSHLPWCSLYFGAAYCSCGAAIAGYPIFESTGY